MKKKILAIALIFVMAAAFCACGTEKTPASADGSADAAKGSGEEVTLYLSAAASMIESMDTVSYTHLDVYKRQVQRGLP